MKNSILLTLLIASSITMYGGQSGLRPRGDVNCDWEVNIADVNTVIDSIFDDAQYHSLYSYATDVNGDHEINISDVNMIIRSILGDELPPMPSYSGTLPVLYINTEGHRNIDTKEEYVHAAWWLDAMDIEGVESIGSPSDPEGLNIKGRGNATWTYLDKKPYRLKLDEKETILGMPSSRHWILMSNAQYWMGMMNDALPFEIGRRMGMSWSPRQEPVEVVLNGQYIGLYFLTEKIRVEKDRVNIIEQKDNETDINKVTGGWLLEIDNYIEPGNISFIEGNGSPFWVTPKSPENLSPIQREYITNFLLSTNDAIYCTDKSDNSWENYIDIDSLAIYYLIQEVIDNPEAFSGSCFMHKQRGNDTKLIFGPFWDCGSSFYRWSWTYEFNEFIYENIPSFCRCRWIGEIVKFPHFQERLRYHWKKFYEEVYPTIDTFMEEYTSRIEEAGNCDFQRWPEYSSNNITERMRNFGQPSFHKKVAWLQSQWHE